ncbi:MAG TPA: alpha/beta hydrolase [Acidobacteriota bacterium]|nr:alpha/beta hydrolase [Acidobacteriota bacterium]
MNQPKLHFEITGAGRPVLLLHGFGANSYTWKYLRDPLSHRFRLIMPDLKGHGLSPKPNDKRYSVYDQAELIHRLIIDQDLKDFIIVGHSFGGAICLVTTLRLLETEPARLAKLVLIDGAAFRQRWPRFLRILRAPLLGDLAIRILPNRFQVLSTLRETYYDGGKISDDFVQAYAAPLRMPGAKSALVATARQIVPSNIDDLIARYPTIAVPTLILWGKEDKVVPLQVGERLHQAIPNSRMMVLEECGHVPQEEQPEAALAAIQDFLAG